MAIDASLNSGSFQPEETPAVVEETSEAAETTEEEGRPAAAAKPARDPENSRTAKHVRAQAETIRRLELAIAELKGAENARRQPDKPLKAKIAERMQARAAGLRDDDPASQNAYHEEFGAVIEEIRDEVKQAVSRIPQPQAPASPQYTAIMTKYPWLAKQEALVASVAQEMAAEGNIDLDDPETKWATIERAVHAVGKILGKTIPGTVPAGSVTGVAPGGSMGGGGGGTGGIPTPSRMAQENAELWASSLQSDPKIKAMRGPAVWNAFYRNVIAKQQGAQK